ncbi:hypothetical protein CAPTEDRAFT_186742 [Capitella teleta]|uniref:Uncharacterized protein n=1 Tax=Capitella teleta TaxID=283909 RepID=R7V990_CAPTE|nr:hypothetical protein CAPTEDRAFT_186742 [Capitella teleta]|eukprot:ELU15072.1 hypothetical protein CAPTEDRAFT_186742 [Capitella teleta]
MEELKDYTLCILTWAQLTNKRLMKKISELSRKQPLGKWCRCEVRKLKIGPKWPLFNGVRAASGIGDESMSCRNQQVLHTKFLLFYHSIWKSSIPLKFMDSFSKKALIRRVRKRIWKVSDHSYADGNKKSVKRKTPKDFLTKALPTRVPP